MELGQYRYMFLRPWYKGSTSICYWGQMALGQYRYMLLGHGTRAVQVHVTGSLHQGSTGICYCAMAPGQYRYMLLGYGIRAVHVYVTGLWHQGSTDICYWGPWHLFSTDVCSCGAVAQGQSRSM